MCTPARAAHAATWLLAASVALLASRGARAQPPPPAGPGAPPPGPGAPPPGPGAPPDGQHPAAAVTEPNYDPTDMPQHLAQYALNVDFGEYKNVRFYYQNQQDMWEEPRPHGLVFRHSCLRQFITCMLSQSAPEPVCAYNNPSEYYNGFWSTESYCHVFFDNCRRRFRVWRVLDTGVCTGGQAVAKDAGHEPNYNNHHGHRGHFEFEPTHGWNPAAVHTTTKKPT